MLGLLTHAANPEIPTPLVSKVPRSGVPLLSSNLAQSWTFASKAAVRITGMLLVYIKARGHLMPCPLTLPKESGTSTFIACT